ncbi:inactive 2-oxoglutarate-dependent dioxygenase AOP2 [Pyrus ussuriensis x Pyrus communis]|uniref:Inactive 2-oxoglutarate-dependent dioxygenase AOP2 n=1 Tax=Pyrus ussuriensis x Pyrus communis TaxID=2448454 RepID=A0A5N5HKI7_9ROSA|nr:inactive 2-oxoglutarate-dependent dioxygenase AOP2 [Pyrus ussuriensis x Pyrus communis]
MAKLTVVDFSDEDCFKPGTSSWLSLRKDICHALEELGCFVAKLPDLIPSEIRSPFFGTLDELFDFPTETKLQITYERPFPMGYISLNAANESLAIGYPTNHEETKKFTHHFWPNGNDQFRQGADLFAKVMEKLDHTVTGMVFENYGVEKYHDDHIRSAVYFYKFNKYNEPEKRGIDVGMPGHTDKGFSTVLCQNHVKGLEIKSKDDEWISFDPVPSSFIFIAGDGFKVWSNDRIQACKHRVTLRENGVRHSLALFSFKEGETCVPNELVDKDHPLKYKPLHLLEYVQYFMENYPTLGPNFSIKTYCGV